MQLKNHADAVNAVREAVSMMGGLIIPYTVGRFRTLDGDRVVKVGREGVSDTLACINGRFFGIEVKFSDGDRQRKDQETFQRVLEGAGGTYILADFRKGRDGLRIVKDAIGRTAIVRLDKLEAWQVDLLENCDSHAGKVSFLSGFMVNDLNEVNANLIERFPC